MKIAVCMLFAEEQYIQHESNECDMAPCVVTPADKWSVADVDPCVGCVYAEGRAHSSLYSAPTGKLCCSIFVVMHRFAQNKRSDVHERRSWKRGAHLEIHSLLLFRESRVRM